MLYGNNKKQDFVNSVISTLSNNEPFKTTDEIATPTFVDDLATAISKLIKKQGTWHVAGPESLTRYDFAIKIAEVFGLNKDLIQKTTNKEEIRPQDTSLNTQKIQQEGIKMHGVEQGLKLLKKTTV